MKTFNRSCQVHLVLFSSIFYGGYTVLLLLQYKLSTASNLFNKSSFTFLILFPIGVFYFKKLVTGIFNFFILRKQTVLKAKQAELKDRIEELKVETRYYQTKDLIEKYDKSLKTETEIENGNGAEVTRRNIKNCTTPSSTVTTISKGNSSIQVQNNQKSPPQLPQHPNRLSTSPPQHLPQHLSMPLNYRPSPPPPPLTPPPFRSPTWMDRFMDALIGDDSRNQKYALICSQCFNHNGLATPELFDTVRYRCPNCGFFNINKRTGDLSSDTKRIEELPAEKIIEPVETIIEPAEKIIEPVDNVKEG